MLYRVIIFIVKNLRTVIKINNSFNDEDLVCKYGRTKKHIKRIDMHKQEFKIKFKFKQFDQVTNLQTLFNCNDRS